MESSNTGYKAVSQQIAEDPERVTSSQIVRKATRDYEKLKNLISISISCRELRNMDKLSLTDALVHVYEWNISLSQWKLVGKTETVMDNLNPDFTTRIKMPYVFESTQRLKFELWDQDSPTEFEYMGCVETTIGVIMGSKTQTLITDILDKKGKKCGVILVNIDAIKQSNQIL